jgi:DNA-directed RNA polymerase alpha subunit
MPAGPVWTPYEDERLRALALSGASVAAIARQMNRSEAAVRKRAVRLNVVLAKRAQAQAQGEGEMSERHMLDPTPELPNDTPIDRVRFPARIQNVLVAAGLKTVGEVRETSDEALLSFQDFGRGSVAHLRETLGRPSTDGVRPVELGLKAKK